METQIARYNNNFKEAFYTINMEWLNEFFFSTTEDEKILRDPEKILSDGGEIFFAVLDGLPVGTCAMLKHGDDEFELIKMGVLKDYRGKKLGEALIEAALDFARDRKAKKVILETADRLKTARALYEKYGFVKTTNEYIHPLFGRVIFKMELTL